MAKATSAGAGNPPVSAPGQTAWMMLLLLAFVVAQAVYAIQLNHLYYSKYGPFYDSIEYLHRLADTVDRARVDGFLGAFNYARGGCSVFLPFGLVPFFGSFVTASRELAIVLQSLWVLVFAGSLACYFQRCRRAEPVLAVVLALLFVSIQAIYFWHGGLSDFRMDLQCYLLFGTAIVWLLIALHQRTAGAWAVFGFAAGLACLGRGMVAPVYLALTCPLMVVPELWAGRERAVAMLKGLLLAIGVCVAVSGWFYATNWKFLHEYYFVLNTDALARLPLATSARHFVFARDSAGTIILLTAGLCCFVRLVGRAGWWWRERTPDSAGATARRWLAEVEWRALAPALIPAGYLALSGSGLNPYVSMPSAFGYVLCLLSLAGDWNGGLWTNRIIIAVALTGCGLSAITGVKIHHAGTGGENWIAAYAEVSRAISEQAPGFTDDEVNVACFTVASYHNAALQSYLTFDRHLPARDGVVRLNGKRIKVQGPTVFMIPNLVMWAAVPGATDEEKIDHIAGVINREANLVVMPSKETADQLFPRLPSAYINQFAPRIRQRLLETGKWSRVSEPFTISQWEQYTVLRNGNR